MEEVNVTVSDTKRRILVRGASGIEEPHREHAAFRIKLKGDDALYVVDFAGDQFGQEPAVTEWVCTQQKPLSKQARQFVLSVRDRDGC